MNFRAISTWKPAKGSGLHSANENTIVQPFRSVLSRRRFGSTVAGTAALGAALGSELEEERSRSNWSFAPVPIPSGTPALGGIFHVLGPGTGAGHDPIDAEPATITNFNGFVGLAFLSGNVTRTNLKTGRRDLFPFVECDMRFMKGTFLGADGQDHRAAFAFV
jgi:hypothetical protein